MKYKKFLLLLSMACCVSSAVMSPAPSLAATDMFLNINGIHGESMDARHRDWIDVRSFHLDVRLDESTGRACFGDLSIVKPLDAASVTISEAVLCQGDKENCGKEFSLISPISEVKLEVCRPVDSVPEPYYEITLTNVYITSIGSGGSGESSERPTESVTFSYEAADFTYLKRNPDGSPAGNVSFATTNGIKRCVEEQ